MPLIIKDEIYGFLMLCFTEPREFSTDDIALATSFCDQAALAIENARLKAHVEETAITAERHRLARDLHDAVTQTLFSASLIAEILPRVWERHPDEARRHLGELHELIRGALAEMRTLLLELRPSALTEAKFGALLRQLTEAMTGRTRIPVSLAVEGNHSLPPDVQIALYRITQEALNNISKHAEANQVVVNLRCQPEWVELGISDDGRGFDPSSVPPDHLGLGIMHERARKVGATLTIESQPGQGTQVLVTWQNTPWSEENG
jgi:signal transduction histidine kinase